MAPLTIELGAGPDIPAPTNSKGFLGSVRLGPSADVFASGLEDEFTNGQVLLSISTKTATTNWTVVGPNGQSTAVLDALFTLLRGGGFGLIKRGKSPNLSNNAFSIQGPSGQ